MYPPVPQNLLVSHNTIFCFDTAILAEIATDTLNLPDIEEFGDDAGIPHIQKRKEHNIPIYCCFYLFEVLYEDGITMVEFILVVEEGPQENEHLVSGEVAQIYGRVQPEGDLS